MSSPQSFESVRSPAVASLFYPGNPLELQQNVQELLDEASQDVDLPDDRILRVLIVPMQDMSIQEALLRRHIVF